MAKKIRTDIARYTYAARAIYVKHPKHGPIHPLCGRTLHRAVLVYFN